MRVWQQMMIRLARNAAIKQFMQSRSTLSELANRFVVGQNVADVAAKSRELKSQGYLSSLFALGEYVENRMHIDRTVSELQKIARELAASNLDLLLCIDPTQLGYHLDTGLCRQHAVTLAETIKQLGSRTESASRNFLMLDMEDASVIDGTIELYEELQAKELPSALTLQAYLHRTEHDLKKVVKSGGVVRLVKGAFAENKEIALTRRSHIDDNYLKLATIMLSEEARVSGFHPIFATHDRKLITQIRNLAHAGSWTREEYEFEMLFGVCTNLQKTLIQDGEPLRLYLPFGNDWWPYAIRRVGESARNIRFLLRSILGI